VVHDRLRYFGWVSHNRSGQVLDSVGYGVDLVAQLCVVGPQLVGADADCIDVRVDGSGVACHRLAHVLDVLTECFVFAHAPGSSMWFPLRRIASCSACVTSAVVAEAERPSTRLRSASISSNKSSRPCASANASRPARSFSCCSYLLMQGFSQAGLPCTTGHSAS